MIAGELVARQLEWQLKVASAPFTIVSFSSVDLLGASVTLLTSDLLSEETEPAPGGATGRAEPLATGGGGVVAALAMVSEAARAVTRAVLRELDLHLAHLREPENAPDAGGIDPVLGTQGRHDERDPATAAAMPVHRSSCPVDRSSWRGAGDASAAAETPSSALFFDVVWS